MQASGSTLAMDGMSPSDKSVLCGESIRSVTVTLDHLDAALASLLSTCNTARVEAEGYFASLGDDPRLIVALLTRLQDPSQVPAPPSATNSARHPPPHTPAETRHALHGPSGEPSNTTHRARVVLAGQIEIPAHARRSGPLSQGVRGDRRRRGYSSLQRCACRRASPRDGAS